MGNFAHFYGTVLDGSERRRGSVESLLERESVLDEVAGLMRRVQAGAGRVVLLRGEAGVGKTAVIGTVCSPGWVDRVRVLVRGWCDALATPRPLGPLLDALAGLGGAAGGPGATRRSTPVIPLRSYAAAAWRCLRDGAPVGVGDRGRCTGPTAPPWIWCGFLSRRIRSLPLLLLVSYRDDELDAQHPLSIALGDVANCAAISRIGLAPLSRDAVAVLATGSGLNADELHQLTGGNPFFVTEVLAAGPAALAEDALPRSCV